MCACLTEFSSLSLLSSFSCLLLSEREREKERRRERRESEMKENAIQVQQHMVSEWERNSFLHNVFSLYSLKVRGTRKKSERRREREKERERGRREEERNRERERGILPFLAHHHL